MSNCIKVNIANTFPHLQVLDSMPEEYRDSAGRMALSARLFQQPVLLQEVTFDDLHRTIRAIDAYTRHEVGGTVVLYY